MVQLTADEILKMTPSEAAKRFSGSAKDVRKAMTRLVSGWHPDVCDHPRANEVFEHIIALREKLSGPAPARSEDGRILVTKSGKRIKSHPVSTTAVDQGEVLLGRETYATIYPKDFADLAEAEKSTLRKFRFAGPDMEKQMNFSLPTLMRDEELQDGSQMLIMRKGKDEILLSDIIRLRGVMPDVHVAWLGSGLLNITAWLGYSNLVHGAISAEHILIDPIRHSVRLVGGWCFATQLGERPSALPGRSLDLVPRMAVSGVNADATLDLELIRQCLREALGDPRGTQGALSQLPAPIASWINLPPKGKAVDDYAAWQDALVKAWGPRKFVDYPLRAGDLYR